MRTRLLAPLAGLALTAALVAGCGPAPGAAGSVDGEVIGEDQVAAVVADLGEYGLEVSPSQALITLVTAPTILDIAADGGLGQSDEDARAALDRVAEQSGVAPATDDVSDSALLVVRSILARSAMDADPDAADLTAEFNERVAELDVTLSPRYGTWDPTTLLAVPSYGWLVVPEPEQA